MWRPDPQAGLKYPLRPMDAAMAHQLGNQPHLSQASLQHPHQVAPLAPQRANVAGLETVVGLETVTVPETATGRLGTVEPNEQAGLRNTESLLQPEGEKGRPYQLPAMGTSQGKTGSFPRKRQRVTMPGTRLPCPAPSRSLMSQTPMDHVQAREASPMRTAGTSEGEATGDLDLAVALACRGDDF